MQMSADDAEVQQQQQCVRNVVYKSQMHSEGKDWGWIQANLFTDMYLNKKKCCQHEMVFMLSIKEHNSKQKKINPHGEIQ
jgi:hypothetical protein